MNKQSSEVSMSKSNTWTTPDGVKFEVSSGQNKLSVRFKKLHPDAVTPTYAKDGDAGLDLTAIRESTNVGLPFIEYGTGISVEIPRGYVGLIFPRSSVSKLEDFYLKNSVGVIDSGYRGELMLRFNKSFSSYKVGDKIGQLIILPYPTIYLEEVEELSNTERGEGGFGSTGV
jgi:dUTP pyrophosphatase